MLRVAILATYSGLSKFQERSEVPAKGTSKKAPRRPIKIIMNNRNKWHRLAGRMSGVIGFEGLRKKGQMKHSAKVMLLATALSMTNGMMPQALAQTQPANPGTPAAATPSQQTPAKQQTQQQDKHPKAKGAAAGAAVGAVAGNAAAGAVIGAGHSRRQARRDNR